MGLSMFEISVFVIWCLTSHSCGQVLCSIDSMETFFDAKVHPNNILSEWPIAYMKKGKLFSGIDLSPFTFLYFQEHFRKKRQIAALRVSDSSKYNFWMTPLTTQNWAINIHPSADSTSGISAVKWQHQSSVGSLNITQVCYWILFK